MSERCLAKTSKGYQCQKNSAQGYLTCNIKCHIEQIYDTKNINLQKGGGWGGFIEPISSLKKNNNKKLVQMGGGWGSNQISLFGLFGNK